MSFNAKMLGPEGFGTYEIDLDEVTFRRTHRSSDFLLVPGFVDIHIHGAFGLDFMSGSTEDLLILAERLEAEGYEGFLPTTVTASPEAISAALARLPEHPAILGFHLEGPFISRKYPGAQPQEYIVSPPEDESVWDAILDDPRLRVVTLAPELPGALDLTLRLMKRGVIVSMGHTDATYEEARRGYEFGATHTTHTFNAMRALHHREAGTVGYALSNDSLTTELIYDRVHVTSDAARLLLKCKPIERVIAVSDATMAAGMASGLRIDMWGLSCIVGHKEVRLGNGTLAGSAITLLDAFKNLAEDFGPEIAIHLCCINPRRALGMTTPRVYTLLDRNYRVEKRFELTTMA